jgi:hypothetical protein
MFSCKPTIRDPARAPTIGDYFAREQHLLRSLPTEPFETGRWFTPRVNRFSQISVRGNVYSVPVRFIGRQLRVLLHANDLVVYDGRTVITRHERLGGRHGSSTQRSTSAASPGCGVPWTAA